MTLATAEYFCGVDIGQARDFSAIAVVRRKLTRPESLVPHRPDHPIPIYAIVHLERIRGMQYPDLARHLSDLLRRPELYRKTTVVVDSTGVGRAVADQFREAGVENMRRVIFTGGQEARQTQSGYDTVPKTDIVGALLVNYNSGRIRVNPKLRFAHEFRDELSDFEAFQNKQTGHVSYESKRDATHDDIVTAVGLAVYWATERAKFTVPVSRVKEEPYDPLRYGL